MVKLYDIDVLVCITKPWYETYYVELVLGYVVATIKIFRIPAICLRGIYK